MTASNPMEPVSEPLSTMRKEYRRDALDEAMVAADPFDQFARWFVEAQTAGLVEANAMAVATVSADGTPSARTVLLKGFDDRGFRFFSNYDSPKGRELLANPRCALLFYWAALERQVRITGTAERIAAAESDAYFAERPLGGRIGAVASPQSEVIPDRGWLAERFEAVERAAEETGDITRPAHWGGTRVVPDRFEFWQGRPNRLHDRIEYRRGAQNWTIVRLAP